MVRARARGRELSAEKEERTLELKLHQRIRDVPRESWDALVGDHGSPFLEWTWLDCLEEAKCVGGDSGWHPCHLALYERDVLIAAAPAYLKENSEGEFVFDWGWAEAANRAGIPYYPKLLLAVPFTPATGACVIAKDEATRDLAINAFASAARGMYDEGISSTHALFVPESEVPAWERAGFVPRIGIQFHWFNDGYKSFEEFLARMPQKKRTQIRRERSQPAKDGITIETVKKEDITPELARTMHAIYLTTVDKFTWGRRYLNRRFFELVAERFSDRLAWVVAKEGDRVVAGAFNVEKGGRLYGRYWGTFVDRQFLHFNVCFYHGIEHAISRGLSVFEPGAGGEHKRARGFLPTMTRSMHHVHNTRFFAAVKDFVAHERRAVMQHVEEEREDSKLVPKGTG